MPVKLYQEKFCVLTFILTIFVLLLNFPIQGQPKKRSISLKEYENQIIMNVGATAISFGEAKQVYDKNSMRNNVPFEAISIDSARSFLKLYAKYKMKVTAGIEQGYDKDTAVVNEIERNKKILAESFLLETELIEPQVRKYTNMRKVEKQIAIIICNYTPNGDTTDAHKNIMAALQDIKNGASFEDAAKKYSADSASANSGGIVPMYITGMRLQREVEDAIYSLKIGEVTQQPIKTSYGYFLIKLVKEQPRQFIGVSHILIPFKNDNAELGPIVIDSIAAKKLVDSLYKAISSGANFNEIAKKFSSDKANAIKGGNLGVYARSTGVFGKGDAFIPQVEETAFFLKDKQISSPIVTTHGYHIIRRDSTVRFSEDFEYNELKSNYSRLFLPTDKQDYFDSIAVKRCNFKLNQPVFNNLLSSIDTTKTVFDTSFVATLPAALLPETLYSINGTNYTVQSFVSNAQADPAYKITAANRAGLQDIIRKMIHPIIIDLTTTNIHKTHPQFNAIIEDFSSGLVLFKTEEENVWKKITFDTALAKQFYDTTSMDLTKQAQFDVSEIYVLTEDKAKEIYAEIKSNKISFDSAAGEYTQRSGFREKQGRMGFVNTSNRLASHAEKNKMKVGDISEPVKLDAGWAIIRLNGIAPQRKETFEEALPKIAAPVGAEFTKKLEADWNRKLEQKYPVKYNEKLIKSVFK